MRRLWKTAVAATIVALLCAVPAAAQETNMRTALDDCYRSGDTIECVWWAVGNGFRPHANVFVASFEPVYGMWWEYNQFGQPSLESRPDVCSIVVWWWGWTCNEGGNDLAGYRQVFDISQLTPGWHYVNVIAWTPGFPGQVENSPYIYVFYKEE